MCLVREEGEAGVSISSDSSLPSPLFTETALLRLVQGSTYPEIKHFVMLLHLAFLTDAVKL